MNPHSSVVKKILEYLKNTRLKYFFKAVPVLSFDYIGWSDIHITKNSEGHDIFL